MKMPHIVILLMIILLDIFGCGNYPQKEKSSVFGMIENIRIDGKENTAVLVKTLDNEKAIEYEELMKMLFVHKRNQGARVLRNQIRREELKKKFLNEFRTSNDLTLLQRRREDMLTNFSFLTKLS